MTVIKQQVNIKGIDYTITTTINPTVNTPEVQHTTFKSMTQYKSLRLQCISEDIGDLSKLFSTPLVSKPTRLEMAFFKLYYMASQLSRSMTIREAILAYKSFAKDSSIYLDDEAYIRAIYRLVQTFKVLEQVDE